MPNSRARAAFRSPAPAPACSRSIPDPAYTAQEPQPKAVTRSPRRPEAFPRGSFAGPGAYRRSAGSGRSDLQSCVDVEFDLAVGQSHQQPGHREGQRTDGVPDRAPPALPATPTESAPSPCRDRRFTDVTFVIGDGTGYCPEAYAAGRVAPTYTATNSPITAAFAAGQLADPTDRHRVGQHDRAVELPPDPQVRPGRPDG